MTVAVMAECLDLLAHGLPDRIQKGLPENGGRVRLFAHGFLTVLGLILRRAGSFLMGRYSLDMGCWGKKQVCHTPQFRHDCALPLTWYLTRHIARAGPHGVWLVLGLAQSRKVILIPFCPCGSGSRSSLAIRCSGTSLSDPANCIKTNTGLPFCLLHHGH